MLAFEASWSRAARIEALWCRPLPAHKGRALAGPPMWSWLRICCICRFRPPSKRLSPCAECLAVPYFTAWIKPVNFCFTAAVRPAIKNACSAYWCLLQEPPYL